MKTTISLIKADIGGLPGHATVASPLKNIARNGLKEAEETGLIKSSFVFNAGDDLELLFTHTKGADNTEIHKMAWDIFKKGADKAEALKLYAAGQDLLKDSFSGNVKGMGPGVAEMEIEERRSDPIVVFAADKTEPGAWNFPLYNIFANPMSTAGLVIDPAMTQGFKYHVLDVYENKTVILKTPEELHTLIALIGTPGRYVIERIWRASDNMVASTSSVSRLSLIAGKYVGKDDPVCIVRAQHGLPAVGEILMPFFHTHLVEGWMRGSHWGPLMPVGLKDSKCTAFDGPPRVIGLGFQVAHGEIARDDDGNPMIVDFFEDVAFDNARKEALELVSTLRRMGEFEPARLSSEAMEYTTLPQVLEKLKDRFTKSDD